MNGVEQQRQSSGLELPHELGAGLNGLGSASETMKKRDGDADRQTEAKRIRLDAEANDSVDQADRKSLDAEKVDIIEEQQPTPPQSNGFDAHLEEEAEEVNASTTQSVDEKPSIDVSDVPEKSHVNGNGNGNGTGLTTPADTQPEENKEQKDTSTKVIPLPQLKYSAHIIRTLKKHKDAHPFVNPVDWQKLGIPSYPVIVARPMDLSTVQRNLELKQYHTLDEFKSDVELIWRNCEKFNGLDTGISQMARRVEEGFKKSLANMPAPDAPWPPPHNKKKENIQTMSTERPRREIHQPERDMPYNVAKPRLRKQQANELRYSHVVMKELMKRTHESYAFVFYKPVDPVALNIPDYFTVIKEPMDLSTIQNKLNQMDYESWDDFEADIRLMFRNAYRYNAPGSGVHTMAKRLEVVFDEKKAAKPAPQPVRRESKYIDDDDEDDEDEYHSQSINLLTQQLAILQNQLEYMQDRKKKKSSPAFSKRPSMTKASSPGAKRPSSSKRKSKKPDGPVTADQKAQIASEIQNLDSDKIDEVAHYIKTSRPDLASDEEEIELDIEALDEKTLQGLYAMVILKQSPHAAANGSSKKKSKSNGNKRGLTEAEQQEQIKKIEQQLAEYNEDDGDKPLQSVDVSKPAQESSDEGDSDSDVSSASSE